MPSSCEFFIVFVFTMFTNMILMSLILFSTFLIFKLIEKCYFWTISFSFRPPLFMQAFPAGAFDLKCLFFSLLLFLDFPILSYSHYCMCFSFLISVSLLCARAGRPILGRVQHVFSSAVMTLKVDRRTSLQDPMLSAQRAHGLAVVLP
jgi:hypothetical protein